MLRFAALAAIAVAVCVLTGPAFAEDTKLNVKEGDAVRKDQQIAVIRPDELRADTTYYGSTAAGLASQVGQCFRGPR